MDNYLTDEQIDLQNQQIEQFKKYYSTIADIKAVIGKLDVLKLYTDNNFNDVILKSLIEDCILSLNNTLGDDKHKPIRVILPEAIINTDSIKKHELVSISKDKDREVQDIETIAEKYIEPKKIRKPQIKKQVPIIVKKAVVLPESNIDTGLGILRATFKSTSVEYGQYYTKDIKDLNVKAKTLRIIFLNGRIYDYKNVPLQIWNTMLESDSVGRYVQKNIVKNYEYLEVTEETVG